jgi:ABC-type bacteriocin/lantibiotic exporter with double-glycine peptidase domain
VARQGPDVGHEVRLCTPPGRVHAPVHVDSTTLSANTIGRSKHCKTGTAGQVLVRSSPATIDIRNFSFYYDTFQALDGISLNISQKRITALIGASGSGKSTLLRAINRMHDNTPGARSEGEILFDGENIVQTTNLIRLRKRVGMIF